MDKSSIIELRDAFDYLADTIPGGHDSWGSDLSHASNIASSIARVFDKANPSLAEGWRTVEDFCDKINKKVVENVQSFAKTLDKFCEETYSNEAQANRAVEDANDEAEQILKELGL